MFNKINNSIIIFNLYPTREVSLEASEGLAYKSHSRMRFSRMSIPLVGCTYPVAAAKKYHLRCCIYLADHAKTGSERI